MKICKCLVNEICFVSCKIVPCIGRVFENEETVQKYFIRPYDTTTADVVSEYNNLRNKYIREYLEKGVTPAFCKNCNDYSPVNDDFEVSVNKPFDVLFVNNRSSCHCKCVYCCLAGENNTDEDFDSLNKEVTYDIKPILEEVERQKLVAPDMQMLICGGEPTEHPEELDFLIDFCQRNDSRFRLFTNGTIYNKNISEILINGKSEVVCSLDSGQKETYEKIKRIKAWDKVTENLSKYANAAKNNPNSLVRLKYILCPPYNDNLDEMKKFLELAESLGVPEATLSLDRFWLSNNQNKKVPDNMKETIKYFLNYSSPVLRVSVDYSMLQKWWLDKVLEEKKSFWQRLFHR